MTIRIHKKHLNANLGSLGQRIRELRIKKGMTQVELSRGISTPSMISQVESDRARPSYKLLSGIAARLEVTLDQLLDNVEHRMETLSMVKMASSMVASKQYVAAIPLLQNLLDTPNDYMTPSEILISLGECNLNCNQLKEATDCLRKVLETEPSVKEHVRVRVTTNLGKVELRQKRYQLAIHYFQQAYDEFVQSDSRDVRKKGNLLFHLGLANARFGQVQDAIACYQQSLSLYKGADNLQEVGELYMELADSYKRANDLENCVLFSEKALTVYEVLENQYEKAKLEMNYAALLGETERTEEAIAMLETSVREFQQQGRHEDMGIALIELAKIHVKQGEEAREQAVDYCQIARTMLPELHPYQAWGHRILGQLAVDRCDLQEAAVSLQKSGQLYRMANDFGNWESTMKELAQVYQRLDEPGRVIEILNGITVFTRELMEERGIVL